MRDLVPTLRGWMAESHRFALATVVRTWGSSPRPVGSVMAIREDGLMCGSVSGGCVEASVIATALEALKDGTARELVFDSVSDEVAWSVGLSCGGSIRVWLDANPVDRDPGLWAQILETLEEDRPLRITTNLDTGAQRILTEGESADGFVNTFEPEPTLVMIGAAHIAVALVALARTVGFRSVVIDPRAAFADPQRFTVPPDLLKIEWPDRALAEMDLGKKVFAVVLSHDPKIDEPALAALLSSPVAYIGALGSRTTQAERRRSLSEKGFTDADIDRIHGPVGLNIGARSPEEIALSIMAEIVQVLRAKR